MERIETKRLILRNFKEEDYDDLYEFWSREERNSSRRIRALPTKTEESI